VNTNDSRWQIAFWFMGVMTTVWLAGLTQAVVANDRLNSTVHASMVDTINKQYTDIVQRLSRIEAIVK
jgi:hypothetical protein